MVATIGTRDWMYQTSQGKWLNLGDDRQLDPKQPSPQQEAIADLQSEGMPDSVKMYRAICEYLCQQGERYLDRLQPVILGRLLAERHPELAQVYWIGTDQANERYRQRDTLPAAQLLKVWVGRSYPQLPVTVWPLTENPSDFETMFQWWRRQWRAMNLPPSHTVWACLKGGVGQTAEAGRVSGLSALGDRIAFFDFSEDSAANLAGQPSRYIGPYIGRNYLWDRTQQQALTLLARWDYAGVDELLQPMLSSPTAPRHLGDRLRLAMAWNVADLATVETQYRQIYAEVSPFAWWQIGYEAAYLATVRHRQGNSVEAFFHSFRAVEGLFSEWGKQAFAGHVEIHDRRPYLQPSILQERPALFQDAKFKKDKPENSLAKVQRKLEECQTKVREWQEKASLDPKTRPKGLLLYGWELYALFRAVPPDYETHCPTLKEFWDNDEGIAADRNRLFHQLQQLTAAELFAVWREETAEDWEQRVLAYLNAIAGQCFPSLAAASIMHRRVHPDLQGAIADWLEI
ncbi:MAG TPA: hypothetical protein DCQ32_00570 [Cyanobacteria bacterium UBA8156]|nr:hypothetical protein [Cyanobacteria bacterium UBA8156]